MFSVLGMQPDRRYALLLLSAARAGRRDADALPDFDVLSQTVKELSGVSADILRISAGSCAILLGGNQAARLCDTLSGGALPGLRAGMSLQGTGAARLPEAMWQAKCALDACYFTGAPFTLYAGREGNAFPEQLSARLLSLPKAFIHLPGKFVDQYEAQTRQITSRLYSDSTAFKKALCAMVVWLSMQTDCIGESLEDGCMGCIHQISESETLLESVVCFEQFTTDILSLSSFSQQMPAGVTSALLYIHSNLDHPLTLHEIAEHTHLNPSYLSTLFHRVMRQSPISYVNSVRIERARILLRNTDLPVSQIASSLGFSQDIYFYRLFKRLSHETPSEYRAAYRHEKPGNS